MKKLNNIVFVSGAEVQSHGSTPTIKGRIRFNSTTDIWEYSENNGDDWYPFSQMPQGGTAGQVLRKNSSSDFDASWVDSVGSVNGMTGNITIGGFSALTCYVVGAGGNDNTAQIGNILRPFETIGAAINVARLYTGALIEVLPGAYTLNDTNCPFGLMYPSSSYSYYFHPNAIITYNGTYGLYAGNSTTDGDIYGYGQFIVTYDGAFTANGYAFYAQHTQSFTVRSRQFNFVKLVHGTTSTSITTSKLLGIGSCPSTSVVFNFTERILCRHGDTATVETGGRVIFNGYSTGSLQSTSRLNRTLVINDANQVLVRNCDIFGYGNASVGDGARNAPMVVDMVYGSNLNSYIFSNLIIYFYSSTTGYKMVNISNADTAGLTLFDNVKMRGRLSAIHTIGGNSLYSDFNVSLQLISVYGGLDIGGTGTITNSLNGGIGFLYNPTI